MIIANNQPTAIFTMSPGARANSIRIPAVMISQSDGTALRALTSPNATARQKALCYLSKLMGRSTPTSCSTNMATA